jgi:hypothetical protein
MQLLDVCFSLSVRMQVEARKERGRKEERPKRACNDDRGRKETATTVRERYSVKLQVTGQKGGDESDRKE